MPQNAKYTSEKTHKMKLLTHCPIKYYMRLKIKKKKNGIAHAGFCIKSDGTDAKWKFLKL